jgi:hypothetical protein
MVGAFAPSFSAQVRLGEPVAPVLPLQRRPGGAHGAQLVTYGLGVPPMVTN